VDHLKSNLRQVTWQINPHPEMMLPFVEIALYEGQKSEPEARLLCMEAVRTFTDEL